MRIAKVENGVVIGVEIHTHSEPLPAGAVVAPDGVSAGDSYDGSTFTRPAPRLPPPAYRTFIDAQDALIGWVDDFMESVTKRFPKLLTDAWTEKRARAERYTAGQASPDDIARIETEAGERGTTGAELAAVIEAKGKSYLDLEPLVSAMFSNARDALELADPEADPYIYDKILAGAQAQAKARAAQLGL